MNTANLIDSFALRDERDVAYYPGTNLQKSFYRLEVDYAWAGGVGNVSYRGEESIDAAWFWKERAIADATERNATITRWFVVEYRPVTNVYVADERPVE